MPEKIIPNPAWFPTTLQERAAWFQNYYEKSQAEGLNYGLTQANLDQIKEDNIMFQTLASSFVAIDTYTKSWTAFRNGITTMPVGSPAFEIPAALVVAFGGNVPPTGIFQRVIEYRDVVIHSLNYTPEVGQNWGYETATPQAIVPVEVKPTIQLFPAANNAHFSCVVTGRGEAKNWDVYIMRKGGEWTKLNNYEGKSADIYVTLTTPGEPEQIQVRIQLRKNNGDYGQVSEPAYVTLNP